jgi:hypothetical protein
VDAVWELAKGVHNNLCHIISNHLLSWTVLNLNVIALDQTLDQIGDVEVLDVEVSCMFSSHSTTTPKCIMASFSSFIDIMPLP